MCLLAFGFVFFFYTCFRVVVFTRFFFVCKGVFLCFQSFFFFFFHFFFSKNFFKVFLKMFLCSKVFFFQVDCFFFSKFFFPSFFCKRSFFQGFFRRNKITKQK